MASLATPSDKTLSSDQVRLLIEVLERTWPSLKIHEWNQIADSLGVSNGKAVKERFRYLMKSLMGEPEKSSKTKTSTTSSKPPTKPPLKSPRTVGTADSKRTAPDEHDIDESPQKRAVVDMSEVWPLGDTRSKISEGPGLSYKPSELSRPVREETVDDTQSAAPTDPRAPRGCW